MTTWLIGTGSILLIALWVIGLVDLFRNRRKMETWQLVVWALFIILVPIIGLVTYLFWRIMHSEAMLDALSVEHDAGGPGDRPPINPTRR